mgnify:CR=1 FL=1
MPRMARSAKGCAAGWRPAARSRGPTRSLRLVARVASSALWWRAYLLIWRGSSARCTRHSGTTLERCPCGRRAAGEPCRILGKGVAPRGPSPADRVRPTLPGASERARDSESSVCRQDCWLAKLFGVSRRLGAGIFSCMRSKPEGHDTSSQHWVILAMGAFGLAAVGVAGAAIAVFGAGIVWWRARGNALRGARLGAAQERQSSATVGRALTPAN